jgi:hypothetical protein
LQYQPLQELTGVKVAFIFLKIINAADLQVCRKFLNVLQVMV